MQEAKARRVPPPDPMGAFEQVMREQARLLLAAGVFRVTEVYRPTNKIVLRFEGVAPEASCRVAPDSYEEGLLVRESCRAFYLETGAGLWSEAGMEV